MTELPDDVGPLYRVAVKVWGVEDYVHGSRRLMVANLDPDGFYVDGDICLPSSLNIEKGHILWLTLDRGFTS
jgi:hypothetical protein